MWRAAGVYHRPLEVGVRFPDCDGWDERLRRLGVIVRDGCITRLSRKGDVREYFVGRGRREAATSDRAPGIVIRVIGSLEPEIRQKSSLTDALSRVDVTTRTVRQLCRNPAKDLSSSDGNSFESAVTETLRAVPGGLAQAARQLVLVGVVECCREVDGAVFINDADNVCAPIIECSRARGLRGRGVTTVRIKALGSGSTEISASDGLASACLTVSVGSSAAVMQMLSELSTTRSLKSGATYPRAASQVAYVVVGGSTDCAGEILYAVRKKWPVFLIEESGGFAHHLASVVRRIESICPCPGIDDFRTILASGDPVVAEILINGKIFVVSPGCNLKEFQQAILFELRADETLERAWRMYAHWHFNEGRYLTFTRILQVIILLLSILTMSLTIVQSFLQLIYPGILTQNPSTHAINNSLLSVKYFMLGNNLALIVLPILSSLFQAVLFKLDPAAKFVALRRSSQLMLREIYMYRTETRGYSREAVFRQKRVVEAAKDDDAPAADSKKVEEGSPTDVDEKLLEWLDDGRYFSKQDLLHRRVAALCKEVSSDLADAPLEEYSGSVPPVHISASGDDGFSVLSPDDYVKFRLDEAQKFYIQSSTEYRRQFYALTYLVYAFGSIGTMLAAFAVYGSVKDFNLQFWVALTTSVQNALSRFLDYTRVELLMQEHSKAKEQLTNVNHWWSQLHQPGIQTDSQINRDILVGKVETCITREVEATGSHMKNVNAKIRQSQEQLAADLRNAATEEFATSALQSQLAALKLGDLSGDNIKAALEDPSGQASARVVQALERICEINELKPLDDESLARLKALEKNFRYTSFEALLREGVAANEFVPVEVLNMMRDPKLLPRLLESVNQLSSQEVSRQALLDLVKGELHSHVSQFPLRRLLVVFRTLLEELVVLQFEQSLQSININLYQLVGTRAEAKHLIGELAGAVGNPTWQEQSLEVTFQAIKDTHIRKNLEKLGESTTRALLKRAERFFGARLGAAALLRSVTKFIAVVDVDELLSQPQGTLDRAALRATILSSSQGDDISAFVRRKSRVELLELLPPEVRQLEAVSRQSKTQLASYFSEIVESGYEFSLMGATIKQLYGIGKDPPFLFLKNLEMKSRFFSCLCDADHNSIYNVSHDAALRILGASPYCTQSLLAELRSVGDIAAVTGACRAATSRSVHSTLFRELCRSIITVDGPTVFPTLRDRMSFIDLFARGFVGTCASDASAADILLSVTPRLALRLQSLTVNQLLSLVTAAHSVCSSTFALRLLACARDQDPRNNKVDANLSPMQCFRIVYGIATYPRSPPSSKMEADLLSDQFVATALSANRSVMDSLRVFKIGKDCGVSVLLLALMTLFDRLGLLRPTELSDDDYDIWNEVLSGIVTDLVPDADTALEGDRVGGAVAGGSSDSLIEETESIFPPFIAETTDTTAAELRLTKRLAFAIGPSLLFDHLAAACWSFDVHGAFSEPLQQYLLILLLEAAHRRAPLAAAEALLSLLNDAEWSELFEPLATAVRQVRPDDIGAVVNVYAAERENALFRSIVHMHSLGRGKDSRLQQAYLRAGLGVAVWRLLGDANLVREVFFDLDSNVFACALADDRHQRICEVVGDDTVATTISKAPQEVFKDLLGFLKDVNDNVILNTRCTAQILDNARLHCLDDLV